MSNLNCTGDSSNVANQLRFMTLCRNNGIQGVQHNSNGMNTASAQILPAKTGNIPPAKTEIQTPNYQHTLTKDSTNFSYNKYSADDGKISAKEKLINFGKGVISPVTAMFSSPKNFIIGTAGIAGGGLLIAATGGAVAPVIAAAGVIGGGIGLLKSGYSAMNAKTDDEARKAWQGIGLGSAATIGSIAGSKAALKSAGIDTNGINALKATVQCFKSVPVQVGKSVTAFTSGKAILNIKNALHIKNNDTKSANSDIETDKINQNDSTKNAVKDDVDTLKDTIAADIKNDAVDIMPDENNGGSVTKKTSQRPVKAPKAKQRRPSRIKHKAPQKQVQHVKKEAKNITDILDDFANNNNLDPQFKGRIEDIRRIAAHPMENPKADIDDLISTIKHLESCRDNTSSIASNGEKVDFPFDDTISYVEKLLSKEYKVDRLQAKAGDIFDTKTMSAFEVEHTNDSKLNNTVFKMLFSGFKKQERQNVPPGWKIKVIKYTTD